MYSIYGSRTRTRRTSLAHTSEGLFCVTALALRSWNCGNKEGLERFAPALVAVVVVYIPWATGQLCVVQMQSARR